MTLPLTMPCAHNFCKLCLLEVYDDQSFVRERAHGGRTLRTQKIVKKCPSCPNDISDFLQNPQINRELMDLIESLQKKIEEDNAEGSSDEASDIVEKTGEDGSEDAKMIAEVGSDVVEEKEASDDKTSILDKKKNVEGSGSEGAEEKKLEPANGDSTNSGIEEGGEGECQSPAKKANSRKRKQTVSRKAAAKKKKSTEVEDMEE